MADFCTFVPDDPSCQTPPEPEVPVVIPDAPIVDPVPLEPVEPVEPEIDPPLVKPEPIEPKPEGDWDMEMEMPAPSMVGGLAFLAVAVGTAQQAILELFRYKEPATFYTTSDAVLGSTNWWKIANLIGQWGGATFASFLALLQILSMFGIGNNFNTTLWLTHIFAINPTVVFTVWVLKKLAYDTANTECQAGTANACDVQDDIAFSQLTDVASQALIYLTFSLSGESWFMGQMYNMDMETKMEWMEKVGMGGMGKGMEKGKEMMDKGEDMMKEGGEMKPAEMELFGF